MQKLYLIVFLAVLISITACNNTSIDLLEPIPSGTYSYTSYDTSGTAIVKGQLSINYKDSSEITGEWQLEKLGNPQNIGPQVGSGKLIGGITDRGIWFDLNPQFRDNNLQLTGTIENNKYSGVWQWISFSGITNHGTFEAIKN